MRRAILLAVEQETSVPATLTLRTQGKIIHCWHKEIQIIIVIPY